MAKMIPSVMENDNNSWGEKKVFEALKTKLSAEYTVFHSVRWNDRNEKDTVVWGECDFTVFHPKKGILVIEVKSGGIECVNDHWTYIRTDNGERYEMKNPMKQADRSKYRFKDLRDEVLGINQENQDYCLVETAVWFPSVSRRDEIGEMPMEFKPELVLLEDALEKPEIYIDKIYDFYHGRLHTKLSAQHVEDIINAFAPHYRAMPSLRSKREEQEDMFERLTKEQNALLGYLEEQRVAAIQGAAGTGKTWLAVAKAKELAKSGKVLFLCFNQFLRLDLQGLKDADPKEYKNIDFMNLPQLVAKKIGVFNVDKDEIHVFLERFDSYDWDYKHIVIDEGQDFDDIEIEKLNEIALLLDGAFYVFYDKNQFVQGRGFPNWLKNAECRLVLTINCRNTYAIADTSGKTINVEPKVKDKLVKGDMPQFYICGDIKNATKRIATLIDQYRQNEYRYDQICIITTKTEEKSFLNGIERIGNHKILSVRSKEGVLFTTARKFKGLESDVIILVDVEQGTFADDENKRLFYVGASRAKHYLNIIHCESDEDLKVIASELIGEESKRVMVDIAKGLNVKPVDCRKG